MVFGFGKKKKEAAALPAQPSPSVPVEQILGMRQQGLTNNQIIQALQKQNYSSSQIFDAMNQADLSANEIPQGPSLQTGAAQPDFQQPPPQQIPPQAQPPPPGEQYSEPQPEYDNERMEETVESIINEKWEELVKDIGKIVEWKNKIESKLSSLEQEFKDLKSNFENLHKAIISKVGEYDQNILNVGTEIKAMERVFQKVLPKMTENVDELSRITKNIKGKKK